jgi:protein gp37
MSTRWHRGAWGKDSPRWIPSEKYLQEPLKWNADAARTGIRQRVFSLSMGDIFEEHPDLPPHRERFWALIRATPMLDWLLLTKRPIGFRTMLPPDLLTRPNVWPGVTVECADYTWRLDQLVALPAVGPRWVSYEPALGAVDFTPWLPAVSWIIIGGESGPKPRPFDLAWARGIIAQCRAAGVVPFVKQLGLRPVEAGAARLRFARAADHHDPTCWPADLRVREIPEAAFRPPAAPTAGPEVAG